MLSNLVQFCTQWIEKDPQWSTFLSISLVILVLVGPRKCITIKKTGKNKWTMFFIDRNK